MEAEIGDVHRWAKEHQGLWAATRNWTGGTRDSPSRPPERTNPASVFISGFQPLNSKRIPICVKQSSLWWFVVAALESDTPQLVFSVVLTLEVWCQKLKLPPACLKAFLLSQYTLFVFKALLGCPTSTWNACPAPNSSSHCLNLFFPHYASLSRCPSSPGQAAKTSPLAPTQERQPCPDRRASSPALTWAASSSLWPLHWWSHLLPPSWLVFLFFGLLSFESISYSASRWSIRKYSPKRNLDVTFPDEKARSWHSSA